MDREAIIARVKEETRIKTDRVTTLCQYNIDQVQDLHISKNIFEHQFNFLKEYDYLNLSPSYTTGTVDMTQDSTAVSGTTTVWASTHVGWIMKIAGQTEYYEVATVTDATNIVLKSAYIGDTDTGLSYTLYKVYYDLATDFGNMRWIKQIDSPTRVDPANDLSFQTLIPDDFDPVGDVFMYLLGSIASNVQQVRFSPIQTSRKRLYYSYDKKLASINTTGAESIIPTDWHWLFVHKLSEIVFRAFDMKTKADDQLGLFNSMLKTFINEDLGMLRDRKNVMQDETLYSGDRTPYAQLPSKYSPDLY